MVAIKVGVNGWLPIARIFIMARSLDCSTPRGRRYVCSPSRLRPHSIHSRRPEMPRRYGRVKAKAAFGGALRAALTRPTQRGHRPLRDEGVAFVAGFAHTKGADQVN